MHLIGPNSQFERPIRGPETTTLSWEAGGGRLLEADDGTRLHECRRYDERGRLRLVRNLDPSAGSSCDGSLTDVPLAEFGYHYDGRGNRLWEDYRDANTSIQERTEYGYDAADRLTGVRYPGGAAQLYRLGGDGSRMGQKDAPVYAGSLGPAGYGTSSETEETHVYDGQGGLTAITDGPGGAALVTYDVDAAGRVRVVTRGGDRSEYTWDAGGRLTAASVRKGGTTSSYAFQYDFAGRRIRRTGPEGESRYVWGAGELHEEIAPDGGRAVYERGAGMAFGVTRLAAGGAVVGRERLLHDGLDSVVGRVGASGVPVLYRYDAWGGFRGAGGPAQGEPSLAYAGQHWDHGLGLSYAQQRWYEPGSGRFLSEDPLFGDLTRPNSLMAFGYANGNPLIYLDPLGLASKTASNLKTLEAYLALMRVMSAEAGEKAEAAQRQMEREYDEVGAQGGDVTETAYYRCQTQPNHPVCRRWGPILDRQASIERLIGQARELQIWLQNTSGERDVSFAEIHAMAEQIADARDKQSWVTDRVYLALSVLVGAEPPTIRSVKPPPEPVPGSTPPTAKPPAPAEGPAVTPEPVAPAGEPTPVATQANTKPGTRSGAPKINVRGPVARPYKNAKEGGPPGTQQNHLNQDAAYRSRIPKDEGLTTPLRGDAFSQPGTPHYRFHQALERFWAPYRRGGSLYGTKPTNAQYGAALERALIEAGESAETAKALAEQAAAQRRFYGLNEAGLVPDVPGKMNQSQGQQ